MENYAALCFGENWIKWQNGYSGWPGIAVKRENESTAKSVIEFCYQKSHVIIMGLWADEKEIDKLVKVRCMCFDIELHKWYWSFDVAKFKQTKIHLSIQNLLEQVFCAETEHFQKS